MKQNDPHTRRRRQWCSWSIEKDLSLLLSSLSGRQRKTISLILTSVFNCKTYLNTIKHNKTCNLLLQIPSYMMTYDGNTHSVRMNLNLWRLPCIVSRSPTRIQLLVFFGRFFNCNNCIAKQKISRSLGPSRFKPLKLVVYISIRGIHGPRSPGTVISRPLPWMRGWCEMTDLQSSSCSGWTNRPCTAAGHDAPTPRPCILLTKDGAKTNAVLINMTSEPTATLKALWHWVWQSSTLSLMLI